MADDAILDELLTEAESRWVTGTDVCAAQLLASHPEYVRLAEQNPDLCIELERSFAAIRAMHREFGIGHGTNQFAPPDIPGFEIEDEIDYGGMGIVYLARQKSPARSVALKVIRDGRFASERQRQRFRIEADVVAKLKHPSIVEIYEAGEYDGGPYLALEYMPGGSLAQRITPSGYNSREAARIVETLAIAVDEAHKHGVVHRDIKPSNVLFTARSEPKLSDFGLARLQDADDNLTRTGETPGTPNYMAPEQVTGDDATTAVDVYALGAVLYELLVGRPPFQSSSHGATLLKIQTEEPHAIRKRRAEVPADLQAICLRCLEKLPDRRYRSAAALAADLRCYLTGRPTQARPLNRAAAAIKWARRRPTAAALAVVSFVSTLAIVAGSLWYSARLSSALDVAEQRRIDAIDSRSDAERHLAVAEEQERIASEFQYAVQMRQAFHAWDAGQIEEVQRLLEEYDDGARWSSHRGFEWYYLKRVLDSHIREFQVDDPEVYDVAFSPQGTTVAACGQRKWLKLWDVPTGRLVREFDQHRSCVNAIAFSPDGSRISTASCDKTAKLWEVASGQEAATLLDIDATIHCIEFRRDGYLAIGDERGTIHVFDTVENRKIATLDHDQAEIHGLAWSVDDKLLASTNYEHGVRLWSTHDWSYSDIPASVHFMPSSVAFSPDSKQLATGDTSGDVIFWNLATLEQAARLEGHVDHVRSLIYTPNGNELITAGDDGIVMVWEVDRARIVRRIRGHRARVQSIAISPDSATLATAALDGTIKLWNLRGSPDRAPYIEVESTKATLGSLSPSGSRLATAPQTRSGRIDIWDVPNAKPYARIDVDSIEYANYAWSADERLLAASSDQRPEAYVWDVESQTLLHNPRFAKPLGGRGSNLSPDGRNLLAIPVRSDVFAVHDLEDDRDQKFDYPGQAVNACFFPDGEFVACIGFADHDVHVFSIDGKTHHVLPAAADRPPVGIAVSADARFIVVGDQGGTVRVVDVANQALHRVLRGHEAEVSCVAISGRGRTVASADTDGLVRLWHVATGELLSTHSTHGAKPLQLIFTPDDAELMCWCEIHRLAADGTGTNAGELYVWSTRSTGR